MNNGRTCIACRGREYTKAVSEKDIKKFKKLKADTGGWVARVTEQRELFLLFG